MKVRNPLLVTIALAVGGGLPLAASAADKAGDSLGVSSSVFIQLDTNKDGAVTRDEAKRSAEVTANFTKIDANHDGKITTQEWAAFAQGGAAPGASGSPDTGGSPGMSSPSASPPAKSGY